MIYPLMPSATAVWLIDNTTLTFEQIADFCGLHQLEVQGIADGEVSKSVKGIDPVNTKQLTKAEIVRCEADPQAKLQLSEVAIKLHKDQQSKNNKSKYIPIARRQDKPSAIAYFLKRCPEMTDNQITKLIGTTKSSIDSIRNKTHWDINNIKPRDPVLLGLCSQAAFDKVYQEAVDIFKNNQNNEVAQKEKHISQEIESLKS